MKLKVLVFLVFSFSNFCFAQAQTKTYKNTRKLLAKMERSSFDSTLRNLFQTGDDRINDLIKALDDSDNEISLNAQIVIRALGNEKGTEAMYEWFAKREKENKSYSIYLGSLTPLPLKDWEFKQIDNYLEAKDSNKKLMGSQIYALILDESEKSNRYFQNLKKIGFGNDVDISQARKSFKENGNLSKAVLKNAFFLTDEEKNYSIAKLMAYNKSKNKALIYIKTNFGALMETWYHVVLQKTGNEWKFYSLSQTANS